MFIGKLAVANTSDKIKTDKRGHAPVAITATMGYAPRKTSFINGTNFRLQQGLSVDATDDQVREYLTKGELFIIQWNFNSENESWTDITIIGRATKEYAELYQISKGLEVASEVTEIPLMSNNSLEALVTGTKAIA